MKKLGVILLIVSFLPWLSAFAVPWMPLTLAQKAILTPALFVIGELLFWCGVLLVGKEVADRYRRWLSPRAVWKQIKQALRK